MEEEIFKIIYKYFNDNREIDANFVFNIIEVAKKYYSLDDYIRKIKVYEANPGSEACYYLNPKKIEVYTKALNATLDNLTDIFPVLYYDPLFKYLYCIKLLIHEVEHANQQKKIKELNNIESEILKAEFEPCYKLKKQNFLAFLKIISLNQARNKHYTLSPCERLAETSACEFAQNLSLQIGNVLNYEVFEYFKLKNGILRGYNIGLARDLSYTPTKTYLKIINPQYDFSKIEELSYELDLTDKMRLGLEVPMQELNNTAEKEYVLYNRITRYK